MSGQNKERGGNKKETTVDFNSIPLNTSLARCSMPPKWGSTKNLSVTNLSEPLVEVNEMLTLYVQRELKSTVPPCLFYTISLCYQNKPSNQDNHSVVKTTNLFLQ